MDCAITPCQQVKEDKTINAIDKLDYKKLIAAILEEEDFAKLVHEHLARAYKPLAGRISISSTGNTDVAMLDGRIIIVLARAVSTIIKELHRADLGVEKTYKTATQLYYWPGMKKMIRQAIDNCNAC